MVYETPDGSRIGFQMYNMMGAPGRKIEVDVGNARLANTVQYNLASDSYIPLRLEGEGHVVDCAVIRSFEFSPPQNTIPNSYIFTDLSRSCEERPRGEAGLLLLQWPSEGVAPGRWKWGPADEKKAQEASSGPHEQTSRKFEKE